MRVHDLPTPALVVDADAFAHNVDVMAAARPGDQLRPHVKAFKSTALARQLVAAGHHGFCCATTREMLGMVQAGLGHDLLLANEVLDTERLTSLARAAEAEGARVTVAVDSDATVRAAATAGIGAVLVDVNVGMPRCGCAPADAGRLAEVARAAGLSVRGVMGYEGHLMTEADDQQTKVERSMAKLLSAYADVGGNVVSGGGTGTYASNRWCTEIQAGSYTLMDTHYGACRLPFRQALFVWTTVVSVSSKGYAVVDGGLKAFGMDHGNPAVESGAVWFCSDEHTTFGPAPGLDATSLPTIGARVRMVPAHVDPTVAYHERMWVAQGDDIIDEWPIDLRGW